jgi:hypothetical protein
MFRNGFVSRRRTGTRQMRQKVQRNSTGNNTSSRSHLVIQIDACSPRTDNNGKETMVGSVWLLDLARTADFDGQNGHTRETNDINASLGGLHEYMERMHELTTCAPDTAWLSCGLVSKALTRCL